MRLIGAWEVILDFVSKWFVINNANLCNDRDWVVLCFSSFSTCVEFS